MRPYLFALALLPLAACGPKSEPQPPAEAPAAAPAPVPAPAPVTAPPAASETQPAAAAAPAPVPPAPKPSVVAKPAPVAVKPPVAAPAPAAPTADLENGKRQFAVCRACHTLPEGGANLTGPNLHGVFGRQAGGKPGYVYSEAMKSAGFRWTAARMDAWLANPKAVVPGTKMTFFGVKDAKNRADLVAFLQAETR